MQALLNAETGLHSAVPFTAACAGGHPWATGSRGQLNCEKDVLQSGDAQRSGRGQPSQAAASRPTTGGTTPQVQSLRFMPGVSSPAQALALLNSSSLSHRGRYGALPGMSNLLPHGPFGTVPSNALGSGPGGSGSGGACSPYRPAAASSQMVPSPDPPASYRAAPVAPVQLPQQGVHAAHMQQTDWPASRCLDTLQLGAELPPLPQLPPFCLPVPAGPGGSGGEAAGPPQFGEEPAKQQSYHLPCLDMDFELRGELGSGSTSNESSPATMIGLHALMDEVQEHGDALTSTLMVNSDIFKPMPLQGTGEAERERLAREAARALRLLHGDSITPSPSPECAPLLPMHPTVGLRPPVLEAAEQQRQRQQQQAVLQQQPAVPQQQQEAAAPQQPGGWLWQVQVPPQLQVQPSGQKPVDSTVAAAPKALPLERFESSALTSIPRNGWGGSSSSSGGSRGSGGSSSDWGQVSSSGSECSGGCEASGACSDGGVAALLALCSIAKQPEIQSVRMKPDPAVQQPREQQQQQQQAEPKPRPPRARQQQVQRAQQQQAQQAQQAQRTARKPRKPRNPVSSDSGSGGKSPAAAAKLGVKRGSVRKARAAPASCPAPKRARAAPAAPKASAAPACKVTARPAGKAPAGSGKGPGKPEPKRALSIDLLEAEGCFDMQQDKAAAHMGFGKTWFKEAIKKIGIERWPYRQLSTLKQSVLLPLEEAIAQHGRLCSPRRASELLAAVRAEYAAVRDKAMRACTLEDSQSGQDSRKDDLLSDAMRGLRQDIAYKPRNEAKRAAGEGSSIPEEKLEKEVQRVVHKWHAKLCQP